jgi:hypothetical protein
MQDRLLLELLRDAAAAEVLSEGSSSPSSASSSSSSATNPGMPGDGVDDLVDSKVQVELTRIFGSFRFFAPSVLATASMGERGSDVFQTIARELTQFVPANGLQVAGKMFAAVDRARKRSQQAENLEHSAVMQQPAAMQAMQPLAATQQLAAMQPRCHLKDRQVKEKKEKKGKRRPREGPATRRSPRSGSPSGGPRGECAVAAQVPLRAPKAKTAPRQGLL